ncbi:MAG: carbohydrate ABC transporter permease [Chloroflexi bacterium]|nr:carbohydrate ABC transporter permease [Chloroflexota bacterium]
MADRTLGAARVAETPRPDAPRATPARSFWTTSTLESIVLQAAILLGAALMLLPLAWMVSTSFKPAEEVITWPPQLIPQAPTFSNYTGIFDAAPFDRFFLNSAIVSIASTVAILATSSLAGFIFAKYDFPLKNLAFMLVLATAMVPFETYMLPLYLLMRDLEWINTYQGLVAPYLVMSFGIFFMRQAIGSSIPDEILDAARIDGSSEWGIYWRIILPLSTGAIGALGIFAFMQAWAAFIWPLLMTSTNEMSTMELGLGLFQNRFTIDYGLITAGASLSFLAVLAAFLFFRRQIIQGITLTGMK